MSTELERCLLDPGYTPPRDALPRLLATLETVEEVTLPRFERALVRAGRALVEPIREALPSASDPARLRLFALLSRLAGASPAPAADPEVFSLLSSGLSDPSPRVRRTAVFGLGKLGDERAETALLELLPQAPPDLARSLVEALGKLGSERSLTALSKWQSPSPELSRHVARAQALLQRRQSRDQSSSIAFDVALPTKTLVGLCCRVGLEQIVAEEVAELSPLRVGPGHVQLEFEGRLEQLLVARVATGVGIAVSLDEAIAEPRDRLVEALTRPTTLAALAAWTRGKPRFRFEFDRAGHQRALAWSVAEALSSVSSALINDPRDAQWTATVPGGVTGELWLSPKLEPDPRFTYRKRDVPAASHPTIAAALARWSRPRPDDVVWDPFVGSALELIERAKLAPYAHLIGSDVDARALDAAKANLRSAQLAAQLVRGDALTLAPPGVTVILSNPPMGRRVARDGSLRKLLEAFVLHAARVLVPGGRLAWLSPLDQRTEAAARRAGLRVSSGPNVDLGGFSARLQLFERV